MPTLNAPKRDIAIQGLLAFHALQNLKPQRLLLISIDQFDFFHRLTLAMGVAGDAVRGFGHLDIL